MTSRILIDCLSFRAAVVWGGLLIAVSWAASDARAQPAAASAIADWKQFETSQQLTDYRLALRDGGGPTDARSARPPRRRPARRKRRPHAGSSRSC